MKAIVHIGTEKTGTSSIQLLLHRNRKKLSKYGFHFVESAGETNNWALPAYCSLENRFDDFYRKHNVETEQDLADFKAQFEKRFDTEMKSLDRNVHTVIISSEHFHSRLRIDDEMQILKKFLSKYFSEIKIVCYLREQAATCASWYSTSLKSGGTDSFYQFVRRCIPDNYYFNYSDFLDNWEKYFGRDALDIGLFDPDHFLNGSLLDDFTSRVGSELQGKLDTNLRAENTSLSPAGQALARAINMAFPTDEEHPTAGSLRDILLERVEGSLSGKGQQLSPSMKRTVYESFLESNETLRRKYFPEIERIFPPPVENEQTADIIGRDVFVVLSHIFDDLQKGDWNYTTEDYERAWTAIAVSIEEAVAIRKGMGRPGVQVVLTEEDGRRLHGAANKVEGRDLDLAEMLLGLARKANPRLPGLATRLEKYKQLREEGPKISYMLTYHGGVPMAEGEEARRHNQKFITWSLELDRTIGAPVNPLWGKRAKLTAETEEVFDDLSWHAFTVFKARSWEHAVEIAKTCPHLESEGWVELVQLDDLVNHV